MGEPDRNASTTLYRFANLQLHCVRGALFVLPLIALGSYGFVAILPLLSLVRLTKVVENATDYYCDGDYP